MATMNTQKRFRYMLMNRQIVPWDQLHLKGQTVDFWWLGGSVTLVAVFSFLVKKFGRWRGPTIGTLSFYDCRLSGGTLSLPDVIKEI